MSARAYAALARNARSGKSRDLLGDFHGTWTRAASLDAIHGIAGRLDAVLGECRGGATVAIHLPRDRRYLATMFAAWARGDAFVPLNPRWPRAHLQRVLAIARPDVVVAGEGDIGGAGIPFMVLPEVDAIATLPPPTSAQLERWQSRRAAASRSYAIFTSGSTGDSKGVAISGGAYDAYIDWAARYWRDCAACKALLVTAELTFDITLGDIAFALAHDVEIHVSPDPSNVFAHAKLVGDRGIDVLYSVPSTIARLFPLALSRTDVKLDGLALVVAGGDAFAPGLIDLVKRASPRAQFHNVYGPTEVTINCVATRVDDQRERIASAGLVPIGVPFAHLAWALDGEEPCARDGWTQGELLVGGAQCMDGYLGDAEGTRRAFAHRRGERYYRTGDTVLRDPDGYLYVTGRTDSLVKVKGYRVSPVAVDNVLAKNPAVSESRTVFVKGAHGEGELVSFVVAWREVAVARLMEECRAQLPRPWLPARILVVDSLPLGPSGKYDDRELVARAASRGVPGAARDSAILGESIASRKTPGPVLMARPRILLVGAGKFGGEHLAEWRRIAAEGDAEIAGIVVHSEESRAALQAEGDIPVHRGFDARLLAGIDAVDIATPSATHAELARQCIAHAHVLVEKPLALDPKEAAELKALAAGSGRVLMVGHLFRFHPVVRELKRLVASIPERPSGIDGVMTNPKAEEGAGHADANLEFLHLFDIVDFLFGVEPEMNLGRRRGSVNQVSIRYPGPMNVNLRMGWSGEARVRVLKLTYSDREISVNLVDNSIVTATRDNQVDKRFYPAKPQALREELRAFLAAIAERAAPQCDAAVGERIVRIAVGAIPRAKKERPRVAVIGGGIFGATCALELARIAQVSLFERHAELLTEVSFNNQFRHHAGFHYPRSYDTIAEIKATRREFEAEYEEAINRDIASYFCTSASGIEIPAERYLAACMNNNLAFTVERPPEGVLDFSKVSLALKTDEAVYDIPKLRRMVTERLQRNRDIGFHPRTNVVSGVLTHDGSKRLTVQGPEGTREESFDYLVNATYMNRNIVSRWFGFPVEPMRFDLYELLVLRLPIPQVCVTIIDGPFTSLVGTGNEGEFLLSHIHNSVSRSVIPDDGMPPQWGEMPSNRETMLRHSAKYLPILAKATDVESRFATRTVNAYARDFDARPTVITNHGFGCWSVLGGKIITCVTNAREIAHEIQGEERRIAGVPARARASSSA